MMRLRKRWRNEQSWLMLAGLAGLAVCGHFACGSGGTTTTTTTDGGTTGNTDGGSSISVSCASDPATASNTAAVVSAVNGLLAALTPAQQTAIKIDKTLANAEQWSNFPAGVVKRNGVKLGDMSDAAKAAALSLVAVAAGPTGSALLTEIRAGDDAFAGISSNSTLFGGGNYYVSIHGTASTTAAWMLQIAGHHVAYNFTYAGKCTSATPLFDGVQPSTWKDASMQTHTPLEPQRAAVAALIASAGTSAQLSGTFSDMLNGPSMIMMGGSGGGNDSKYPAGLTYPTGTSGRGVNVGTLAAAQKALVKTAIEAWVKNVPDSVASSLLAVYESDDALAQTYVGYSGSTDLSQTSSYARIDGPRVWIEFTVQEGTANNAQGQGHYHTIWRDKVADYGAEYVSQ